MSVYVYFKDEEVRCLEGFEPIVTKGKEGVRTRCQLPGLVLDYDGGRWRLVLSYPYDQIPSSVAGVVDEISYVEHLYLYPREAGVYRFESAWGEVPIRASRHDGVTVHIRAQTMEDMRELLHRIKAGTIRPEESYEGKQGGQSRPKLEAENQRLQTALENLQRMEQTARETIALNGEELDRLRDERLTTEERLAQRNEEYVSLRGDLELLLQAAEGLRWFYTARWFAKPLRDLLGCHPAA